MGASHPNFAKTCAPQTTTRQYRSTDCDRAIAGESTNQLDRQTGLEAESNNESRFLRKCIGGGHAGIGHCHRAVGNQDLPRRLNWQKLGSNKKISKSKRFASEASFRGGGSHAVRIDGEEFTDRAALQKIGKASVRGLAVFLAPACCRFGSPAKPSGLTSPAIFQKRCRKDSRGCNENEGCRKSLTTNRNAVQSQNQLSPMSIEFGFRSCAERRGPQEYLVQGAYAFRFLSYDRSARSDGPGGCLRALSIG